MNAIVYHFASGGAFFSGTALLAAGSVPSLGRRYRWIERIAIPIALAGVCIIIASSTPFSVWLYAAWAAVVLTWLVLEHFGKDFSAKILILLRMLVALSSLAAGLAELPYHLKPLAREGNAKVLYVLGDSISAGIGFPNEITWPELIRDRHKIEVINLSRGGARMETILDRVDQIARSKCVVVLEIGGNDLLQGIPVDRFQQALAKLLGRLDSSDRRVVMLELPLPPFCNRYGAVQRTLARERGVILIPKRFFASVLSRKNATTDGLHLSNDGHQEMAQVIWAVIGPLFH